MFSHQKTTGKKKKKNKGRQENGGNQRDDGVFHSSQKHIHTHARAHTHTYTHSLMCSKNFRQLQFSRVLPSPELYRDSKFKYISKALVTRSI